MYDCHCCSDCSLILSSGLGFSILLGGFSSLLCFLIVAGFWSDLKYPLPYYRPSFNSFQFDCDLCI